MNELSTNTILIGFSVFITLVIVTSALIVFGQIKDIYNAVPETSISIKDTVENIYDKYNGSVLNGVGLINTLKKYESDSNVTVTYSGGSYTMPGTSELAGRTVSQYFNDKMKECEASNTNTYRYEHLFNVKVTSVNNKYTIKFTKK